MRLKIATNPNITNHLAKVLMQDPEVDQSTFLENVHRGMTQNPDNWFVVFGTEDDEIIGYVICACAEGEPFIYIIQAWGDPKYPTLSKQAFLAVIAWAKIKGRKEIRMDTFRDHAAFTRRWNFVPISTTMSFKLENLDGKQHQDERVLDTNASPTGDQPSDGSVPDGSDELRRDEAGRSSTDGPSPADTSA